MKKILFFLLFFTLISCFKEDEPSVDQIFLDWNSTYLGVDSITNFYPLELKTALQEVKIVVDSALRDYKIFTPRDYDPSKKYPLLFCFHGYTSSAKNIMQYSKFNGIADKEGFIVVYPQGLRLNGSTHWNVGGWTLGSNVNDVKFVESLIDNISTVFSIDEKRIYSTGMSNGGFMSFKLACQLSDKIAAIASVTGSMTPQTYDNCNPSRSLSILQIHGDSDRVVPYVGARSLFEPISNVLSYWSKFNSCSIDPILSRFDNIDLSDNSRVEEYSYVNCLDSTQVSHYKVIGGGHDWFGAWGNMDINSSELIWSFVSQFDLDGKIN